ncbi:SRPBCC family protein [Arthrobacter celericrescens]|uniref:SRPBCC family protein n=1 Tax=Arthrobacter celericrescens TaxID=2320851 RepID=UPI000EA2242C|nr:SRPBCC family protein [Arthrobacter celericrescens]
MGKFVGMFQALLQVVGAVAVGVLALQKISAGERGSGGLILVALILCLILSLSYYLRRWKQGLAFGAARNHARTKVVRVEESVTLQHPADEVWALIRPAENSVALGAAVHAFKVPGTPDGAGEWQCSIAANGQASILEVLSVNEGRSATVRSVFPERTHVSTFDITDQGNTSTFTYACQAEIPSHAARQFRIVQGHFARDYFSRIAESLARNSQVGGQESA